MIFIQPNFLWRNQEQYRLLNILHLFVHDFGEKFATMETVLSTEKVKQDNLEDLRYCMRNRGESGYVFINNYQRLAEIKDHYDVVIDTGVSLPFNRC